MRKRRNPLNRRILREFVTDWKRYVVVALFMILFIGFATGLYSADLGMNRALANGYIENRLENGHFRLEDKADARMIDAIESGKKADLKAWTLQKAEMEFNEKFDDEFKKEFDKEFEKQFDEQIESFLPDSPALSTTQKQELARKAKEMAVDSGAFQTAYRKAWDESYPVEKEKAWKEVQEETDEKYEEAVEDYSLDDPDFEPVRTTVYENFYREEPVEYTPGQEKDITLRVFNQTADINLADLIEGEFPENENEIALDRMHADNNKLKIGDVIEVGNRKFTISGLIAYVNYSTLHVNNSDIMFDALTFGTAMVTNAGFERLDAPVRYNYAWTYQVQPEDETEENRMSENFLSALLTQSVVYEDQLEDYVPRYQNAAVNFAPDDIESDRIMMDVLINVLIVVIAFTFAITISSRITSEAGTIGTLRASGYTRTELLKHYMILPVVLTLVSAVLGNLLGYFFLKWVVIGLYYNSYSLPAYEEAFSVNGLIKTTLIPVVIVIAVIFLIILLRLQYSPLELLRKDLKKKKNRKAVRLPQWKFFSRFRTRIILQNLSSYLILFAGILCIMLLLAMAVGLPYTLDAYKSEAESLILADYQTILKSIEDEDGNQIHTADSEAEKFLMRSLDYEGPEIEEEISVYGIEPDSKYVEIGDFENLNADQVVISQSFADKYGLGTGDAFTLKEKYEDREYTFTVAGTYPKSLTLSIILPDNNYRKTFDAAPEDFTGYFSRSEIRDIDDKYIATVITVDDVSKMADQLDHSMGGMMGYLQVLCVILAAALIYLLTKVIIEKNEKSISMVKILGYTDMEIARLYILSTSIVLVAAAFLSAWLGALCIEVVWRSVMMEYSGWIAFRFDFMTLFKMFICVVIGYLFVVFIDYRRISRVPKEQALKAME